MEKRRPSTESSESLADARGGPLMEWVPSGEALSGWNLQETRQPALLDRVATSNRPTSIGTFAGNIAHDINNPLAAILGNLDFLAERLNELSQCVLAPATSSSAEHAVFLYSSEEELGGVVGDYLAGGAANGDSVLVISTRAHQERFLACMNEAGIEVEALRRNRKLLVLDACELLGSLMVRDMPDQDRFNLGIEDAFRTLQQGNVETPVRAYGEMVDLLFCKGRRDAARRLESMWNDAATSTRLSLLCAYDARHFRSSEEIDEVCNSHGRVLARGCSEPRASNPWPGSLPHTREVVGQLARFGRSAPHARWDDLHASLADARAATFRVCRVGQYLKLLSKPDDAIDAADLDRAIAASLKLLPNEVRQKARIVTDCGRVGFVRAYEAQLTQVFLHLIVRAGESLAAGKVGYDEIRITTRIDGVDRTVAEICTSSGEVTLDTRPGKDVLADQALSVCRQIVEQWGGEIDVTNAVERGGTIRVALRATPVAARNALPPSCRRGRVLLIDDEPLVSRAVKRVLCATHDVTIASSAARALGEIEAGEEYDVIICDVSMEHMSGTDFYQRLSTILPGQAERVVFLTGGALSSASIEVLNELPDRTLEEPFSVSRLRELVDDVVLHGKLRLGHD